MAKKSPTIDEVKKAKIKLESSIAGMMQEFEKENKVRLGYIDIQRRNDDSPVPLRERNEPGPIENVNINMDLDLVY